ncbi:hypothetical protein ACPSKX_13915 [Moritella viscosa]
MTEWFSFSMMPAFLLLVGGLLLPLFKGNSQKYYSTIMPLLVIFSLTQMEMGSVGEIGISVIQAKEWLRFFIWVVPF